MGNTLVVVESPAKAKTIKKYLGGEYTVVASVGHIRDLPKTNADAVDIENGFTPRYVTVPGKSAIINDIKKEAKRADAILLATDPDREGEAIAWHLVEAADLKNPQRVVFNEITKDAVLRAIAHPRKIDQHLRRAQEARRVLDRLVGYDLSGLIWKKVRYGLSAGRVQSPALRILMEREREIRAFVPERFFTITAHFKTASGHHLEMECSEEPREEKEADRITSEGKKGEWSVSKIQETPTTRAPRPPFTTSTLQQSASTRLGFSPSRTMRAAQKLYEAGAITYMRTDSPTLASSALGAISGFVKKTYGEEYSETRTYKTKSKNAQEAHEAIRPTDITVKNAGLTEDETRLYALIHSRTVASQMKSASLLRTKVIAETTGVPPFHANGSVVIFDGWLRADPGARSEDVILPALTVNEPLSLTAIQKEERSTTPPKRYSEAGLIKELEKRGIGRPSTYASIMKTILDRGYVEKEGRTLLPTATGDVVSSFLEKYFSHYISDSFTAEMENELDQIASGEREYAKTLSDFYTPFQKEVSAKADIPKLTSLGPAPEEFPCPLCGSKMEMKLGKNGVFMSCVRFPECPGARTEKGEVVKDDTPLGIHPETGFPIFVRVGRFGPYVEMREDTDDDTKTKKKTKKKKSGKRASITPPLSVDTITLKDAVRLLILPRDLGPHPETGEMITANTGRYGPYIAHAGDFRSLKGEDDPYTISLPRALEILKEPKKTRAGIEVVRVIGPHPKTKKPLSIYKSKRGYFLKKGFKHIMIPEGTNIDRLTPKEAVDILKQ